MAKTLQKTNSITEGVIWRPLLSYFFPILFGTFFQQLYNTVGAVVVGNFVGKEALAAVGGSTGTIINLLVGFFVGLSSGATIIIAQLFGAGRSQDGSKAVHTAMAMALVGGAILMVLGFAFSGPALRAMGTPEDIYDYALTYMLIYFGGIIFNMVYNIGSGILRAVGDSKSPLIILIICSVANLVLDLLFVVVFHMEVVGVAVAMVLAQAISAVLVVRKLTASPDARYKLNIRQIRFDFPILRQITRIGLPNGVQSIMYSLSNIIVQASVNSHGTDIVAAWTAFGKIDGIFWMIMGAFGIAITTFAGQNFGAQRYERIRKSVRVTLAMAFGVSVFLSVVLYLWGPYVYRIFTADAVVIEYGMIILRTLVPFFVIYIFIEVLSGAIRGTGDSLIPTIITSIGICGIRVVWIYAVVPQWNDIRMVSLSFPVAWVVTATAFIIYYLKGGWLRRSIARAGQENLSPAGEQALRQKRYPRSDI